MRFSRVFRPHSKLFACVGCGDRGLALVLLVASTALPQPVVPTTMASLCGTCATIYADANEASP